MEKSCPKSEAVTHPAKARLAYQPVRASSPRLVTPSARAPVAKAQRPRGGEHSLDEHFRRMGSGPRWSAAVADHGPRLQKASLRPEEAGAPRADLRGPCERLGCSSQRWSAPRSTYPRVAAAPGRRDRRDRRPHARHRRRRRGARRRPRRSGPDRRGGRLPARKPPASPSGCPLRPLRLLGRLRPARARRSAAGGGLPDDDGPPELGHHGTHTRGARHPLAALAASEPRMVREGYWTSLQDIPLSNLRK